VIDPVLLRSGQSAPAIAKLAGCSWKTVLRRQHELGIPVRRQGVRDWPREGLDDVPAWMNEDPVIRTRSYWALI
jgi:hypothetical protein